MANEVTPIEIPEAAVEAACVSLAKAEELIWPDDYDSDADRLRKRIADAIAAAVPVMFEAVGHVDRRNLARLAENKTATVWPRMYADADDVPLYALTPTPTKEASGE